MEEAKMTKNAFKLFKKIMELSEATEWDEAKKEWEQIEITEAEKEEDYGECICGKRPIKEMIQMFNNKNRNEVIVGNCCVNKFLDITEFNKFFAAIKQNKVNKAMIEDCFKKDVITEWEKDFMLNVWRKTKNLSLKQDQNKERIKNKILRTYKK